jgi:GMP synthase-like glutamine amidotransferase
MPDEGATATLTAMPIIVFQHDAKNRPGRLGVTLRDHAFNLDTRRLDLGDPVPVDFDDVDGVISLGGTANVDDKHSWLEKEREFIRGAHERGLPVIGVCLGAQLIAQALGGTVEKSSQREAGFVDVDLLAAAHTDTILTGIAWKSPQFSLHRYEVSQLPQGAVRLAKSEHCANQAFRVGMRTYGFQYHFEADRPMMNDLLADARSDLHAAGMTTDEFARDAEKNYEMFARLGDRLCVNFATYLIPRVGTEIRA